MRSVARALQVRFSWILPAGVGLLLVAKLAVIDRIDTPLRRANLVNGGLRQVAVPADVLFGQELVFLGYGGLPERVTGDQVFEVRTYWRALHPGGPDYGVTVHVVDGLGRRWDGQVRPPRWHRTPPPVGEWPADQYALVAFSISLLPGTPPGTYTVQVVAFDRATLAPLTAYDQDGQPLGPGLTMGRIEVGAGQAPDVVDLTVQDRLDAPLGPLLLVAADLDRRQAAPGDPVALTVYWAVQEQPARDLSMRLTLLDEEGSAALEVDRPPTVVGHPTSSWASGEVWRGQHLVRLPAGLESGEYSWRLALVPGAGKVDLPAVLRVTAPERTFQEPVVDHPVDVTLGGVATLVGFDVAPGAVRAGQGVSVTLTWRAEVEPRDSYHVFLHLLGPGGELVAQSDGVPASWSRPTTGWLPGEFVRDRRRLSIPAGAVEGEYRLVAGLYLPGGDRLATADGTQAIPLTTLLVEHGRDSGAPAYPARWGPLGGFRNKSVGEGAAKRAEDWTQVGRKGHLGTRFPPSVGRHGREGSKASYLNPWRRVS